MIDNVYLRDERDLMLVVALLESMWDWHGLTSGAGYRMAPQWFRINPQNKSGKVLYKLVGDNDLIVTESCKELVGGPNQHGTPDPNWVAMNLMALDKIGIDILLLCGVVAQRTYDQSPYKTEAIIFRIKHPGRAFSNVMVDKISRRIQRVALVMAKRQ